jgi:tryptophanyl-tRNA synthetase
MTIKLDPWGAAIPENYTRVMEEFGISPFENLLQDIPDPHPLMKRRIIFGHRDFERVLNAIKRGENFAVMTGLMPSGKMHLGHKLVIDQLIWYQGHKSDIFLCVADLEAYSARGISLEQSRKFAVEEYLANYHALGLNLDRCHIYFQSTNDAVRQLAFLLSKRVNFSEMKAIYGFAGESSISQIFYPMIDIADILHPQLKEFGGPRPTVVPVGIDQDPHLRLARDVASRFQKEFNFILPSSTYHRLLPGLTGEKMSSSHPETAIFLTDSDEEVEKKIRNAFTGGLPTAAEQRRRGGDPTKCRVYELYVYHLLPDDEKLLEVNELCRSGKMICGECKTKAIELMKDYLKEHRVKYRRALPKVRKIVEKV